MQLRTQDSCSAHMCPGMCRPQTRLHLPDGASSFRFHPPPPAPALSFPRPRPPLQLCPPPPRTGLRTHPRTELARPFPRPALPDGQAEQQRHLLCSTALLLQQLCVWVGGWGAAGKSQWGGGWGWVGGVGGGAGQAACLASGWWLQLLTCSPPATTQPRPRGSKGVQLPGTALQLVSSAATRHTRHTYTYTRNIHTRTQTHVHMHAHTHMYTHAHTCVGWMHVPSTPVAGAPRIVRAQPGARSALQGSP